MNDAQTLTETPPTTIDGHLEEHFASRRRALAIAREFYGSSRPGSAPETWSTRWSRQHDR